MVQKRHVHPSNFFLRICVVLLGPESVHSSGLLRARALLLVCIPAVILLQLCHSAILDRSHCTRTHCVGLIAAIGMPHAQRTECVK